MRLPTFYKLFLIPNWGKYTFVRIAGTKLCISYFSSKNICKNFAVSIIYYTFACEFHADGQ